MFLVNSRNPHFTATHSSSRSKSFHPCGHTFSRSYGAILPSSLAKVISTPWNILPTHLCRFPVRALKMTHLGSFLGSLDSFTSLLTELVLASHRNDLRDLPRRSDYMLKPSSNRRLNYPPSHPIVGNAILSGTGILTRFPSPTPLGLDLGPD